MTPPRRWYGWQTLIGLGISHTLAASGFALGQSPVGTAFLIVGSAGSVLTGPIVHWVHGYGWRGVAALGINAGIPASLTGLVLVIGFETESECHDHACQPHANTLILTYITLVTTAAAAPFIDVAALSYETRADTSPPKARFRPSITGVVPLLDQRRTGLAITGQF